MNRKEFEQKFAIDDESGAFVYTADACMQRHQESSDNRDLELNQVKEEVHTGKQEMAKEQRLWAFAYEVLRTKGLRPKNEDLEEFVKAHLEIEEV
jgi:hypothetical protein